MLEIDFDEVYARTNTSYKPMKHMVCVKEYDVFLPNDENGTSKARRYDYEERWYSDYKSASSVERIEAFLKLGRKDPVAYADETGPVAWEVAKTHVENVLASHAG